MERKKQKIDLDKPALPISVVAQVLKIHVGSLRIYDKAGILTPKRSSYNRRLYSLNDIEKGRFIILMMRNFAINISGIKIITKLLDDLKVEPENYIKYMEKVAKSVGIDDEMQKINKEKVAKKGNKNPKVDLPL